MIMNSSLPSIFKHYHGIELVDKTKSIEEISPTYYDSLGASVFIIVVLSWYSIGIVCMLVIQIRAHAETVEDCASRRTKLFIQTMRDQTQRKEILEELVDKQKRNKLWNIYFGKIDTNKEKFKRAERLRIRNLEKKLAGIHRTRMIINETVVTSPVTKRFIRRTLSDSRSTFISHLSVVENQPNDRRRSSFDQQILEQWKSQDEVLEQYPWSTKKKHLLHHFRRSYQHSSNEKTILMTDDEQCRLLSPEKIMHNELRSLAKKSNELSNPYITYFHLPIQTSRIPNLPLMTIKSDHHIIQMNDDEYQC